MQKKRLILLLSFTILPLAAAPKKAQQEPLKIGYADMAYILSLLPAYQKVEAECSSYQNQLARQLEKKITVLKQKAEALHAGEETMAKAEREKKIMELQQLQQGLRAAEMEAQEKSVQKRTTLLQPIYENIQDTIAVVAKAHNYTYIFHHDVRGSMLLYMPQDANISDLVLKKMGIELEAKEDTAKKK